jgi:hypothetical protein
MNAREYFLKEELIKAKEHGLEDPLSFQHKVMMDQSQPLALRTLIANNITPYYHPKIGIATPPKFIEVQVEVPEFKTIEEAEAFLVKLTVMVGAGELTPESALNLSTLVRNWILSKHAAAELEIKRINAGQETGNQVIRIEGGLPELPGSNITMPRLNGNRADGLLAPQPQVIDHDADADVSESTEMNERQDPEPCQTTAPTTTPSSTPSSS